MKLENKKELAARTFNVGKSRIVFNVARLSEIKEAITKQDMKDLHASGVIYIREIKGRRKLKKRKSRRRAGSIRKKAIDKKHEYVKITRKLRTYLKSLRAQGKISAEDYKQIRKEIRQGSFKTLARMKERIAEEAE